MAAQTGTTEATLNGLRISLDAATGSLLGLQFDGPGQLLQAMPDDAGMLDLAYPLPQFEPLRLAARFSRDARIEQTADTLTISWDALGASRALEVPGPVAATVTWRALPDGVSLSLSCSIRNGSERPVRQVLFPDLAGLLPVAGLDGTILKSGGFGSAPFRELRASDADQFYAQSNTERSYTSGGMFQPMVMRWLDLGGLNGGFSLFPQQWGWEPRATLLLRLSETTGKLRAMCVHDVTIAPGATWESPVWVLTPHRQGWARGLEPYRAWARAHIKRTQPLPRQVREGLGYRTLWMCRNQPDDPAGDAIWRFADLPALAREAKDHGLSEMVCWATHPGFALPLPPPFPDLGTEQEFAQAVAACREIGVNVAPFLSVLQANKQTGPRYGLTVPETGGWTYHPELIPRFNPPYAGSYSCAQVDTANPLWQADVLDAAKHLMDLGINSSLAPSRSRTSRRWWRRSASWRGPAIPSPRSRARSSSTSRWIASISTTRGTGAATSTARPTPAPSRSHAATSTSTGRRGKSSAASWTTCS